MPERIEIDNFSIDCAIFGYDNGTLKVLLIKRNTEPALGKFSLPGGFVFIDEDLDSSPMRRLYELTGLTDIFLRQVGAFGNVDRYPLRRVITVLYYALVRISDYNIKLGQDASEIHWIPVTEVPDLAFDHKELYDEAFKTLQRQVLIDPIIFNLLPHEFTLSELQDVYETVTMRKYDKRNFRKKITGFNFLQDTMKRQVNVSHRAARLYTFDKKAYLKMIQRGQLFTM